MTWDLGLLGLAVLLGMSLAFGLVAQLLLGRHAIRWLWLLGSAVFFAAGVVASEVWFGWATEEELQPNIDGLSFDEALVFGLLFGIVAVVAARLLSRRSKRSARV